jgi:hypothetical protein
VFYRTEDERRAAEGSKARIEAAIGPVATAIEPLRRFYRAEDYHQKYEWKHDPYLSETFPLADDHSLWAVSTARGVPIGGVQGEDGALREPSAGCPLP